MWSSVPTFTAEQQRIFDHPIQGNEAAKHLLSLCQGPCSVAEYSVECCILATESGWNEEVFQVVFLSGFNGQVKNELSLKDESDSLDMLISLGIRLDNRMWEWCRESAHPSLCSSTIPAWEPQPSPRAAAHSLWPRVEPMQLGWTWLTHAKCD